MKSRNPRLFYWLLSDRALPESSRIECSTEKYDADGGIISDGEMKAAFVLIMAGALSALLLAILSCSAKRALRRLCFREKRKLKESLEMVKYESVSIYYAEKDRPILELTKETLRDAADMNRELFVSPLQDSVDLIFFKPR